MTECKHGIDVAWCGTCSGTDLDTRGLQQARRYGSESKQEVVNDICDLLDIPRQSVSVGSSVPSEIFRCAAQRIGLPDGSMPEVAEAIIVRAGHGWSAAYDSRSTISGGGSTVTLEGLQAMRSALMVLL